MKITIINGSHREDSQSLKISRYVKSSVSSQKLSDDCEIFSLAGNPLPLWDQGVWDGDEKWNSLLEPVKKQMAASDAFVIVTPEWHGQVPAGLKNFFLLMSKNELGHKPALIITVSSGDGGSYPVAELRMSSYKNNRLCYIPEQIIVRKAETVLNDNADENNNRTDEKSDKYYRDRVAWALGILAEYGSAFKRIRESGVTATDQFNNGM